jgi:hypothetical protein
MNENLGPKGMMTRKIASRGITEENFGLSGWAGLEIGLDIGPVFLKADPRGIHRWKNCITIEPLDHMDRLITNLEAGSAEW